MRKSCNRLMVIVAFLSVAAFLGATAGAQGLAELQESRIAALEKQVAELRQTVRTLSSHLEMLRVQMQSLAKEGRRGVRHGAAASETQVNRGVGDADDTTPSGVGTWLVLVTHNASQDASGPERELDGLRARLADVSHRAAEARTLYSKMSREHESETSVWDARYERRTHSSHKEGYDPVAVKNAEIAAERLEDEEDSTKSQIARLQRKIELLRSIRLISGQTDQGVAVQVKARGAIGEMASRLAPGSWYRMTGTGHISGGVLQIRIRAATNAQGP